MNYRIHYVLIVIALILPNVISGKDSDSTFIIITGNKQTKSGYLQRFIKNGSSSTDSLVIEQNLRKLRTLPSIMEAQAQTKQTDSGTVVTYMVSERYTLFPVGDFGVSNEGFWLGGGLMHSNLFGRGLYTYAYYQYNQQFSNNILSGHPYHIILRNPYLFQSNFGFEIKLKSSPGIEEYYGSTYLNEYVNYSIACRYEFRVEHEVYVGVGYTQQVVWYRGPGMAPDVLHPYNERYGYEYFVRHDIRKLDNHYFYVDGWRNRLFVSWLLGDEEFGESAFTVANEFRYYKRVGNKGNVALQLNTGLSSDTISLFQPFIADNYYNIRGIGYRAYRGNTMALTNLEYRQTIFENQIGGIQAVAFADGGYLDNLHSKKNTTNGYNSFQSYGGLGIRFIYKKAYNAILRIDYGFDLQNLPDGTWIIGWGQYF